MLKGINILLRPLKHSDLDLLEKIENNKENWQFGSEKKKYSKQELQHYITNAKEDITIAKQYRFAIDLIGTPIGFIDLFNFDKESAGVGVIITKGYRKRGLSKEALNLLTNYAFLVLNIKQLRANTTKDNLASIRLFTSCGFSIEKEEEEFQYFIKLAKK